MNLRSAFVVSTLLALGCAPAAASPPPRTAVAAEPSGAPRGALPWAEFSNETFIRAKAERRFVILDGAAEWCHWCHVMEATTYHDPRVRELLASRFIAAKADVDARPDVEERYGEYGWPATVIFSPEGEEIGKYKGYIAPDDFVEILRTVAAGSVTSAARPGEAVEKAAPLSEETLAFVSAFTIAELDEYYDDEQGGWGRRQKAPVA